MKAEEHVADIEDVPEPLTRKKKVHIVWAIIVTLTLAIMGGAQLPLGASFASTGVLVATVLMLLVAYANAFTSDMLCWQAYYVGRLDYETLGHAIGGQWWQLVIEIFAFGLLFGTMITVILQVGEVWAYGMMQFPGMPELLTSSKFLSALGVLLCLPFCFMTKLTALEMAGNVAFIIVVISTVWLVVVAIMRGMPALGVVGEFQWVGFTSVGDIVSAIATFGFSFFIQPVMMPMLGEMPPGKEGVRLLSLGTRGTILGTALGTYWICGFFAAAAFGTAAIETGNWLQNDLGGGIAQGVLNITFVVYLILSLPPFEYGTRHSLDSFIMSWFAADSQTSAVIWLRANFKFRQAILAFLLYGFSLLLALVLPGGSDLVITVVGAVGVGMVSYVVPIVNHFLLYFGKALCQTKPMFVMEKVNLRKASLASANLQDNVLPTAESLSEGHKGERRGFAGMGLIKASAGSMVAPMPSYVKALEMEALTAEGSGDPDTSYEYQRPGTMPIPGGATDYSYIKKPDERGAWVMINEIILPIIILAVGIFNAVATLVTL